MRRSAAPIMEPARDAEELTENELNGMTWKQLVALVLELQSRLARAENL